MPTGEKGEIVRQCPALIASYHRQLGRTDVAIVDHCRDELASFEVPRFVEFV